jgi:hypothetical protein
MIIDRTGKNNGFDLGSEEQKRTSNKGFQDKILLKSDGSRAAIKRA